jgi:hypothetical protein
MRVRSYFLPATRGPVTIRSLLLALALLSITGQVCAQSVSGTIPRRESPQTWSRPEAQAGCPGTTVSRTFNRAYFQLSTAGTYTITATRSDGGFIAIDLYQGALFGTTGSDVCVNRWDGQIVTGMGTASRTFSCSSMCNINFFEAILSGANSTDTGPVTFTVSGPTVTYMCGGTSSLSPNSETGIPNTGGNYSTTFTPASHLGCTQDWTTSSVAAWVTGVPASGNGVTTINYSVAANTGAARSDTMTIGGRSMMLAQLAAPSCGYALDASSANVAAVGGTSSFGMVTTAGCAWTTSESSSWLSSVTASGTGSGTISYTAAENTGPARSDTITSQGQTFTVNQANGCAVTVTPESVTPSAAGGSSSFSLATTAGCAWTVASNNAFVTIPTASGTGPATVNYTVAANSGIVRMATLTATATGTGATDTLSVSQAGGCTASVDPTTVSATGAGQARSIALTMSDSSCPWSASATGGFITPSPTSGSGSGTVMLTLTANTGAARSGSATIAGETVTVNQASACTIDVSAALASVGAAAGSGSLTVTAPTGCAWSLGASAGFLSGFMASGSGTASVPYNYGANTSVSRTGTLTATLSATGATDTHLVAQASGCVAMLSAESAALGASSGDDAVGITLSSSACPWTASSNAGWLTLPVTSGTGNATLELEVSANIGPARTGTITVLGQTLVVTQASGCVVNVAPSQTVGAASGSGTVLVDTEPGCTWTATSATVWLSDVTASGSGDGAIEFDYGANVGAARSGAIEIASSTTASTAEHEVLQGDGCVALLSAEDATVDASAGTGTVTLTLSANDCAWSLSSSDAWLSASPTSGTTSAAISYMVESNASVSRTATLTIAGQTFSVEQESGCAIQLQPATESAGMEMGTLSLELETDQACAWTAAESSDWFSTATTSGTGASTIVLDVDENVGPLREADIVFTATASGATATYTALQSDGCTAMLASDEVTASAAGETSSVALTLSDPSCEWTATASPFITLVESAGNGDASVAFEIAANDGPARTGTITIAGIAIAVSQADGCSVSLTPDTQSVSAAAGTVTFDVATANDCAWTASASLAWITNVSAAGTGPGEISVEYNENTGIERMDAIAVEVSSGATTSFELTQGSGCGITLPVTAAGATDSGGDSSFAVTTGDDCRFTVSYEVDWIVARVVAGGVEYSVDAWDGEERSAVLSVMSTSTPASGSFTVTQSSGCTVMLTPGNTRVGAQAGAIEFEITTGECAISVESDSDFITDVTVTGAVVRASIAENLGEARMGSITVSAEDATGTFVVAQDSVGGTGPDAGIGVDGGRPDASASGDAGATGDGGARFDAGTRSDGGLGFDAGYVFEELVVGRGCSCDIAARGADRPQALGALLLGVILALRVKRRRIRERARS